MSAMNGLRITSRVLQKSNRSIFMFGGIMLKKLTVLILIFLTSTAAAQDFTTLFPFEKFSKWMNSITLKDFQMAGVENMATDPTVSDRKYRAIFSGNQGMLNVQLSQGKFFSDYQYNNDFKDIKSFNKNGLEMVYIGKPQMPMSFIRVNVPEYKATFSIMASPRKDKNAMISLLEQIQIYKYFK